MAKNEVESIIQGNKITYKRHFKVTPQIVFEAWSSREHLEK